MALLCESPARRGASHGLTPGHPGQADVIGSSQSSLSPSRSVQGQCTEIDWVMAVTRITECVSRAKHVLSAWLLRFASSVRPYCLCPHFSGVVVEAQKGKSLMLGCHNLYMWRPDSNLSVWPWEPCFHPWADPVLRLWKVGTAGRPLGSLGVRSCWLPDVSLTGFQTLPLCPARC